MIPKFKKGDKVIIKGYGKTIRIIDEADIIAYVVFYSIEQSDILFREDEIELVTPKFPKFKKGDKVKVIAENSIFSNYISEVEDIIPINDYFVYSLKGIMQAHFKEHIIELIQEKPRKIIGYKVPFDMYNGDWKKGDVVFLGNSSYYCLDELYTIPAEIAETWKPVYDEPKVMIGECEVKEVKEQVFKLELTREELETLISANASAYLKCLKIQQDTPEIDSIAQVAIKEYKKFYKIYCKLINLKEKQQQK